MCQRAQGILEYQDISVTFKTEMLQEKDDVAI